jgi:hypothetical protein
VCKKSLGEETAVKQQNAGNTALTTLQTSQKMSRRRSKKTTTTFQTEISAGRTKNQLAAPADKEPKTDVNSSLQKIPNLPIHSMRGQTMPQLA